MAFTVDDTTVGAGPAPAGGHRTSPDPRIAAYSATPLTAIDSTIRFLLWDTANARWATATHKTVLASVPPGPVTQNLYDDLQRRFRLLLRAWIVAGFPVPPGLECEVEPALNTT